MGSQKAWKGEELAERLERAFLEQDRRSFELIKQEQARRAHEEKDKRIQAEKEKEEALRNVEEERKAKEAAEEKAKEDEEKRNQAEKESEALKKKLEEEGDQDIYGMDLPALNHTEKTTPNHINKAHTKASVRDREEEFQKWYQEIHQKYPGTCQPIMRTWFLLKKDDRGVVVQRLPLEFANESALVNSIFHSLKVASPILVLCVLYSIRPDILLPASKARRPMYVPQSSRFDTCSYSFTPNEQFLPQLCPLEQLRSRSPRQRSWTMRFFKASSMTTCGSCATFLVSKMCSESCPPLTSGDSAGFHAAHRALSRHNNNNTHPIFLPEFSLNFA